ncbi:MAG TPA: DNA polymerase/3'-5' exonuclease PolX [Thermoplasmatales archaeon]|nr:DNA polymerase/3'-5' exonuclease PolX [Thermoplasmatales archaeon]
MRNQEIASIFYEIADLLEIKGELPFKVRAYRRAAQRIETLDGDIEDIYSEGKLREIPGIGEALAKKIGEIIETGRLEYLDRLKREVPEGVVRLMSIPGLGPRKTAVLYKKLGIKNIEELKKAAEQGKLRDLDGFGEVTERNILRGIEMLERSRGRVLLSMAFEDGSHLVDYLKGNRDVLNISIAGSLRRMKETIGDIDILVSSLKPGGIMDFFVKYQDVYQVLVKGSTKTSVILRDGLQVDLRVVKPESFGAALQYFTGSKEHNIQIRNLAIKKGFKVNEYGVFEKDTEKYVAGKHEEEVYKAIGLQYIEPELRENRGEIELAQKNKLPRLIGYNEIKGDFHIHSNWSDGSASVEEIARFGEKLGYEFVGIADHSASLKVAYGLSEEKVMKKIKEIRRVQKRFDIRILVGTECDIKPDGTMDYRDSVLKEFDFVYAAIHTRFKMSRREMTERIVKALENEYVNFLAHPTGRLIGRRDAYEVDVEKIIDSAKENNVFLEINAFPDRLDLNDVHAKMAKEKGVRMVIGTDAHSLDHLRFMRYGIAVARRGWLEKKDVLNTCSLKEIERTLLR